MVKLEGIKLVAWTLVVAVLFAAIGRWIGLQERPVISVQLGGASSAVPALAIAAASSAPPAPPPPELPALAPSASAPIAAAPTYVPDPKHSLAEKARAVMLNDMPAAKALLIDRVAAGKATREETVLLKTICRELHDELCVKLCNDKLANMRP